MHKDELKQRVLAAFGGIAEQVLTVDEETYPSQPLLTPSSLKVSVAQFINAAR